MDNELLKKLNEKQYLAIIKSPEYKQLLTQMCQRIVSVAASAPNEATIENYFDCELFAFFRDVFEPLGFTYNPIKEMAIATKRHAAKGRADTAVGALVIEFKQPATLADVNRQNAAVKQIAEYLNGLENKNNTPLVGFITDGLKGCFVVMTAGVVHNEPYQILSFEILDRIIQNIVALRLIALNPKNIVEDFCHPQNNDGVAFGLLSALYVMLNNMTDKTKMLFTEWKELFKLAHDDISKQQAILDRKFSLEKLVGEKLSENDNEYKALFALQTAYAIIVKIVAYRVVSQVRYNHALVDFDTLKLQTADALRMQLAGLEDGAIFREYGIINMLEGDFFSWYCTAEQWTSDVAKRISEVFAVLSLYEDKAVLNKIERAQDFFKDIYEAMMPSAVRHSLGEYYTKKWLARTVVDEAIALSHATDWRGIDPCCGSGTFVTVMIDNILQQLQGHDHDAILNAILHRVKGIDLNPLAVLTARVNYFINISFLLHDNREIEIPIYLGDASYVPKRVRYDNIDCFEYSINTLQQPINIIIPESMVQDSLIFFKTMANVELHIKNMDIQSTYITFLQLVKISDATPVIKTKLLELASALVALERKQWNGIWARIIANFLTTANLGKFDIIVGNPPWVDWKNLPSGYREKIKSLCISRKLFSGDRLVGGINLNVCALIANVAAENWLNANGILAFLMPEPLIFQQSYEGFRNLFLSNNKRLYFCKFTSWTKAGHPFKPVTQKFFTYFISHQPQDYSNGIITTWYLLDKGKSIAGIEELDEAEYFTKKTTILAACHSKKNIFSHIEDRKQLQKFKAITGVSQYLGREGIEFYPQELMIFTLSGLPNTHSCTALKNIQVRKSKHRVPQKNLLLETEFLYPLVKGVDIRPFHVTISDHIVPFPYDAASPRQPIGIVELAHRAPHLARFYQMHKDLLLAQTGYNERIIGRRSEFYALARVGAYSFAENYVVFRDNTKWGAAVLTSIDTPWGDKKRPMFQNHAVSICEDVEGNFITLDEAHFICGILNAPVVSCYIIQSSDSRSFPIRPRVTIPKYNPKNKHHTHIVALSKEAHKNYDATEVIHRILRELDAAYLGIVQL
jgi:hypothetical protein